MIKKLILLGLGLTLLVGLPLAIFVLQNQTQTKSGAAVSTKFSFGVPTASVKVGDALDIPIIVDPQGVNAVSFVKIAFTYDGTKLDKAATPVTLATGYTTLEAPQATCNDSNVCQVTFTISVGNSTDLIIKNRTTIGSVHLIAKANTDPGTPTKLSFIPSQNQALSTGSGDQAAENVFQGGIDGSITIGDTGGTAGGGTSDTPTPTGSGNGTIDTGGTGGGTTGGGPSGGTTSAGNASVTCSSLSATPTSGNSPLDVTFTSVGTSTSDSIAKIAINYGDGLVDTIASGSGIGTGDVNAQTTHTYSRNGTFTATATLTTSTGAVSNPASCSQTITVGSGVNGNLPPTGPGQTLLLIGGAGAILTILGVALVAGL